MTRQPTRSSSCPSRWAARTPTTACSGHAKWTASDVPLKGPGADGSPTGATLTARGFWGSTVTQGAGTANGDAYLPKGNGADGSGTNPNGKTPSTTTTTRSTCLRDHPAAMSGYSTRRSVPPTASRGRDSLAQRDRCHVHESHFYDTNNTPYTIGEDAPGRLGQPLQQHEGLRQPQGGSGSGASDCVASATTNQNDPWYYHNNWWKLTGAREPANSSGRRTGQTYRIHVTTDPGDTSQDSVNGLNNYAIYASATGGSPQVYGIGAMQMYTPLNGGKTPRSTWPRSKAAGAGKTIEIKLWDPGDTNS